VPESTLEVTGLGKNAGTWGNGPLIADRARIVGPDQFHKKPSAKLKKVLI